MSNSNMFHSMMIGDMNAKVCSDNTNSEEAFHSCGNINDNGERLVNFCLNNSCVIDGTIFTHRDIHKLTWRSPDSYTVNQIDHVVINKKWCRSKVKPATKKHETAFIDP